jgi:glycosyltransferase involved in cell wall biosynthesis
MPSIAILNPLGDYGINQYCHELARGLGMNGARVGFYTSSSRGLPPADRYQRFPVLSSVLFKQRARLSSGEESAAEEPFDEQWAAKALAAPVSAAAAKIIETYPQSWKRTAFLTVELALHLRSQGYRVIWTQWNNLEPYAPWFWKLCRALGLYIVHTIHNVEPHDPDPLEERFARRVYRDSRVLVVHSNFARQEFLGRHPELEAKLRIAPHGLYTLYPRRPLARDRVRQQLAVAPDQAIVLFCGGIRPYKNIDAVLEAMRDARLQRAVLVVAGVEAHYPDCVPGDGLGRTRRLAERMGIADRVRLIPRGLSIVEMAELFEAGDIKVLPYLKGYGSGMLLLAMTFGKHIVSTRTGGVEEYLQKYSRSTLLNGATAADVAGGLACALEQRDHPAGTFELPAALEWPSIARQALGFLKPFA